SVSAHPLGPIPPASVSRQRTRHGSPGRIRHGGSVAGRLGRKAGGLGCEVALFAEVRAAGGRGPELDDLGLAVAGEPTTRRQLAVPRSTCRGRAGCRICRERAMGSRAAPMKRLSLTRTGG